MLADVKEVVKDTHVEAFEYIKGVRDCDDFAAMLAHEIRVAQHRDNAQPWPFFEAWVTKLNGKETNHAVDLALTMQGLYFIEPQRDTFRRASGTDDHPYFIR